MFSASKSGQYQGYQISRSVRLRSSASAYFNRTPASAATNGQKWTYSAWVKRGALGAVASILSADAGGGTSGGLYFDTDNTLKFGTGATLHKTSAAVFRDPSAWYHIVVAADSTLATGANRLLLYINGVQQTWTSGTDPTLNGIWLIGKQSTLQGIGFAVGSAASTYFDGYLTEINFIDGQTLTPSSFGVTNAYGVWSPIKYNGTYGNNGFYLNFNDNSGATATTIGKDNSGNGNNWTPNNISVTAGVTYDSMLDVPTPWGDGGNGRGNYCVINPVNQSGQTITNGNLQTVWSLTAAGQRSTFAMDSAKWYWEVTMTSIGNQTSVGIVRTDSSLTVDFATVGSNAVVYLALNGNRYVNGTSTAYGATFATGDVIGVAVDISNNTVTFYKNGTSQGAITGLSLSGFSWYAACGNSNNQANQTANYNFGQRPFAYTPPSGFNALNTQNLPTPTIANGANYFAATTYTGNGSNQTITNTVNGTSFQPDFVWVKGRSGATDHALYDAVRGVQKQIESNTTTAETTETTGLTAFNSNGFTVGALAQMNTNTATYVGWQWNAGGSTVTNTSGTITSTVRASTTAGCSVVTYVGNATNNATIGHGLGVTPRLIIVKNLATTTFWYVYHGSLAATFNLYLNDTAAQQPDNVIRSANSTTFTVSSSSAANGTSMVAYCFAPVTGFSAFGSYTGNGSADGPFVFCGFRPRWVMMKRIDTAGFSWIIQDTARDPNNPNDLPLYPDLASAEAPSNFIDMLSNGFKLRNLGGGWNASGGTYIFAAFAENPFKYALAR